jgi:hypothetical protein
MKWRSLFMLKILKLLIKHKVKFLISWHPKHRFIRIKVIDGILYNTLDIVRELIDRKSEDKLLNAIEDSIRALKKARG